MNQFSFLTIILCLSISNLFAEGPPITLDGKIDVPYKAFALTAAQKQELNHARMITLTEQQAKKEGMLYHDRKLFILTSNFNDCCCGRTYGIWFHPDSITIIGKDYPSNDTLENGMTMPGRSLRHIAQLNNYDEKMRSITINAQGDLYHLDKKIPIDIDSLSDLLFSITPCIIGIYMTFYN